MTPREWDKIRSKSTTKTTVICGNCEAEWDADKLSPVANCPMCGAEDEIYGSGHIIREEKAEA